MINYLVRLGWSCGDEEIFSKEELIEKFSIEAVGKSAGVFNPEKLLWLNAHYIKTGDTERLAGLLVPFLAERGVTSTDAPSLSAVVKTLQDRSKTMLEMADGAVFYYDHDLTYDEEAVAKHIKPETAAYLQTLTTALAAVADFSHDAIETVFKTVCAELGIKMGQIGPAVRIALSGGTVSPSIYEVMEVLGRKETCRRLELAVSRFTAGQR